MTYCLVDSRGVRNGDKTTQSTTGVEFIYRNVQKGSFSLY